MFNLNANEYYGQSTLEDIIQDNVIMFLKYGFLELGAYYNINYNSINPFNGENDSILKPITAPGSSGYTIYQGLKHDWIWETGVVLKNGSGTQPISISGIYINDVFYPTGSTITGTGYRINYPNGQVIFDKPLSAAHIVKSAHPIRWVNVYKKDSYEYRKLTSDWFNRTGGSGVGYDIQEKSYLPAIFVQVDGYNTIRGTNLGNRGKFISCNLRFDIFANNDFDRKQLQDNLYMLETKYVPILDLNTIPRPFNSNGTLASGRQSWPALVSGYKIADARFDENARIIKNNLVLPVKSSRVNLDLQLDILPV